MNKNTFIWTVVGVVAVILILGGYFFFGAKKTVEAPITEDVVACTMDAKVCPDGSSVGRTGPKCEFAACPTGAKPTTPTTPSTGDVSPADMYK